MAERTRAFKDVRGITRVPPRGEVGAARPRVRLALAAVLIFTLFLGLFVRSSWLTEPQPHPTVLVDLFPDGEMVRGGPEHINQLPDVPGDSTVVLILRFLSESTYPRYLVRIVGDRSGRELWRDVTVRRDSSGSFPVSIPRRALSEVSCSVELFGLDAGTRSLLETYRLQVVRKAGR